VKLRRNALAGARCGKRNEVPAAVGYSLEQIGRNAIGASVELNTRVSQFALAGKGRFCYSLIIKGTALFPGSSAGRASGC